MRPATAREAILAQYAPSSSPKLSINTLFKSRSSKTKGSTLEDFYREVLSTGTQAEQLYQNKNAQEIERMMVQNRKLIEAQRNPRK